MPPTTLAPRQRLQNRAALGECGVTMVRSLQQYQSDILSDIPSEYPFSFQGGD